MEHLEDMLAIGQVLARYCRGVDRLDEELLRSAFWPDSFDDHGLFRGGREDFIAWVTTSMREHYASTSFTLGQSYFEFRGERAAVETHFSGKGWGAGGKPQNFNALYGRYSDLFEKRAGEWKILHRTVVYDGLVGGVASPLEFPHVHGERSSDDATYRIFDVVAPKIEN